MAGYGHIVRPPMREASVVPLIPCAWNARGVSKRVCYDTTRVLFRNEQGCCRDNCSSASRVCRLCLQEGAAEPNPVVDARRGVCEAHLHRASSGHVLRASVSLQAVPHLLLPDTLRARAAKTVDEDSRVLDPALFEPETYQKDIARLSKKQAATLGYLAMNLSDEELMGRFMWTRGALTLHMRTIYAHFALERIPTRSRRRVLVEIAKLWARS
jgi:hypothetical protein